ncbi:MAG TPA: hypothetical protein VH105_12010, partial [Burkholderiales bacterium]|nr:hypothetical protein [Burkholderiales bacterium]
QGAAEAVGFVADIAEALKEQSSTSKSIGGEVERIGQMTEQTRSSARETASAARQMESLSGEMISAVSRFKVEA